jgi:hypothetical protein
MGTLVPNATFAGPTEPIWAYANSGSSATGPTGMKGATGFTGYTGPAGVGNALVEIITIEPNIVKNFALKAQYAGALLALLTVDSVGGGYDLNLTGPDTFPVNGKFFIKNVDNNVNPNMITVFYNNELRGFLYPPTAGVNNGFLCICQIVEGGDTLNIF